MPTGPAPAPTRPDARRPLAEAPLPVGAWAKTKHYFTHRVDPMTSVFLVIPLYLVYQIGTLLQMQCDERGCTWVRNGVDFITGNILEATHGSRLTVAAIALAVGLGLAGGAWWARRRSRLHPRL